MNLTFGIKDKPAFGQTVLFALQQLLAIMAATIAVPAIIGNGMSQTAALFGAGVGTIVYLLFTKFRSPVFLGSSFAFLGSMATAFAGAVSMEAGYVGLIVGALFAGLVYVVLAIVVKKCGVAWIDKLMPAVVIGPTVAIIGLSLAGNAVGDLAMGYYGDFVEVAFDEHGFEAMAERTRELLDAGERVICEATFIYEDNFCMADILRVEDDGVRIVEVKATTELKDYHLDDASYQLWVIEQCGLKVKSVGLMHLNKDYRRKGDIDLHELFVVEDITEEARYRAQSVPMNIQRIARKAGLSGERGPVRVDRYPRPVERHDELQRMAIHRRDASAMGASSIAAGPVSALARRQGLPKRRACDVQQGELVAWDVSLFQRVPARGVEERCGDIPYTVVRQLVENFIHTGFESAVVAVGPDGRGMAFLDCGPGVEAGKRCLEVDASTADDGMKQFIRGVGSGFPIVVDWANQSEERSFDIELGLRGAMPLSYQRAARAPCFAKRCGLL